MASFKKSSFVKSVELMQLLDSYGWSIQKIKGVHYELQNAEGRRLTVPVQDSRDIPMGTQMALKRAIFVKNHPLPQYKMIFSVPNK